MHILRSKRTPLGSEPLPAAISLLSAPFAPGLKPLHTRALGVLALTLSGLVTGSACFAQAATPTPAQAGAPGQTASRLMGTVSSIQGTTLVLKLENGSEATVEVSPEARVVRAAPGQKTLADATVIHLEDLTTGDRVLARATPGADSTHFSAIVVVAMKQADIAQVHAGQSEDWQKRGVSGVVKTADPIAGTLTIALATPGKTMLIHTTPKTIVRRYAPDSVQFADAKTSTLDQVHPGDQLRARGDKSDDDSTLSAEEIVAGSFRNIAGTVTSVDAAHNTVTVTDLATKKPVSLQTGPESQLRKLPPEMAERLASRFKAPQGDPVAGAPIPPSSGRSEPAAGAAPPPAGRGGRGGDLSQMLQRAPIITLADLKKGDAVMIVASQPGGSAGATSTAITLLAGVEPLLEGSSSASQGIFSASWNMGGAPAAEGAQ